MSGVRRRLVALLDRSEVLPAPGVPDALSARLVAEAHGGKLRVSSEPGAGATFTLELPPTPPAPEVVPDLVPGTLAGSAGVTGRESASGRTRTGEIP